MSCIFLDNSKIKVNFVQTKPAFWASSHTSLWPAPKSLERLFFFSPSPLIPQPPLPPPYPCSHSHSPIWSGLHFFVLPETDGLATPNNVCCVHWVPTQQPQQLPTVTLDDGEDLSPHACVFSLCFCSSLGVILVSQLKENVYNAPSVYLSCGQDICLSWQLHIVAHEEPISPFYYKTSTTNHLIRIISQA